MSTRATLASILSVMAAVALAACSDSSSGTASDAGTPSGDGPTATGGSSAGAGGSSAGAGGTKGGQGGASAGGAGGGAVGTGGAAGGGGSASGGSVGVDGGVGDAGGQGTGTDGGNLACNLPACYTAFAATASMCPLTGACMAQVGGNLQTGITQNLCFATGAKLKAVIGAKLTFTVLKTDGVTPCYAGETTLVAGAPTGPIVVKDNGGAVAVTFQQNPDRSLTITCPGAAPITVPASCGSMTNGLVDPSAVGSCAPGICQ